MQHLLAVEALALPQRLPHFDSLRPGSHSEVQLNAQATGYDDSPCEKWTGVPEHDKDAEPPMKCGVLWYLHIPKTGGTTIMHHFHDLHERYNWQYANMWKLQVPPNEKGPPGSPYHWTAWNTTKKWTNVVLPELSQAQPRLIVHAHHNMPGLGDPYMFNQVLMPMKRSLEAKGCELRLATALREPVSEVVSLMLFRQIPFEEFIPRMEENSDAMSKYILWNYHTQWPLEYQRGTTPNANGVKLLQRSRELLSKFSLVGQTENLNQFIHFINLALGWPTSDVPRPWVTGSMKHTRAFTPYTPSAQMLERVKGANVVDSLLYHTFCSKAQAAPQSPTSTVALAAPQAQQAEQAAPDGMIAPMAARRALDAVFETAPPVAVQAPAPAKHGAATIHGATQLSAPFDQPAQTAPAQTVANNTNTEEAAQKELRTQQQQELQQAKEAQQAQAQQAQAQQAQAQQADAEAQKMLWAQQQQQQQQQQAQQQQQQQQAAQQQAPQQQSQTAAVDQAAVDQAEAAAAAAAAAAAEAAAAVDQAEAKARELLDERRPSEIEGRMEGVGVATSPPQQQQQAGPTNQTALPPYVPPSELVPPWALVSDTPPQPQTQPSAQAQPAQPAQAQAQPSMQQAQQAQQAQAVMQVQQAQQKVQQAQQAQSAQQAASQQQGLMSAAFALPTPSGSGSLLSADEQASSTSERQALKGATMNTVAMVQARDQPSLLDQQEKASALELRLKVVRDVMQKFQSAPEGMTEGMALLAREIDGPEVSDD